MLRRRTARNAVTRPTTEHSEGGRSADMRGTDRTHGVITKQVPPILYVWGIGKCYIHQYCHSHRYDTAVAVVAFLIIECLNFITKYANSMRKYKICDISGKFCRYDILLHVFVPQLRVCLNFKDFRLWNPLLHEQYFEQCRDSVNVKTGDVGITRWSYFRVKLSFMFALCIVCLKKEK